MKINSYQLEQQVKQKLASCYLLSGEDPFLLQESILLLREQGAKAGFVERERLDIEKDEDLEQAYQQAYTPPFFHQKRVLELHWKGKLSKTGQDFLIRYTQQPSPHSLLLVRMGKIDSRSEQTAWFKQLEPKLCYVPHWPLPAKQLPSWLMQRAKSRGFQLTADAAQRLAYLVEGNLQAASQEIEKLSLLEESSIGRDRIDSMVSDQGAFSAFDLVDQALNGQGAEFLRILDYLKQEGSEPLLILGAFMHQLRTLTKLSKELGRGASLSTLLNQYRIRPNHQAPVSAFLKRHADQSCYNLILKAAEIDRICKGAQPGNSWEALQIFGLSVAAGVGRPVDKHI